MTRDEAIRELATTTVLDHDTARRCIEAMPNVAPKVALRLAAIASIEAQRNAFDPVWLCKEFALGIANRWIELEQAIARLGTGDSLRKIIGV